MLKGKELEAAKAAEEAAAAAQVAAVAAMIANKRSDAEVMKGELSGGAVEEEAVVGASNASGDDVRLSRGFRGCNSAPASTGCVERGSAVPSKAAGTAAGCVDDSNLARAAPRTYL